MALINTNELYIKVYDHTGASTLSTYALSQTPLTFVPDYSIVQLLSSVSFVSSLTSYTNTFYIPDTNDYSNIKIRWDFGDGTYQISPTGVHAYKYPGQYEVRLYLINENGESFKNNFVANVNVYNFLKDEWNFSPYTNFIVDIPAGRLSDKITINRQNSWQTYNVLSGTGYTFNLYSSGSGTYYYDVKNYYNDKWAHLKKFFKFIEKQTINNVLQDVIVDKVKTSNTEIYAKKNSSNITICDKNDSGAFFVGTTGSADFYYTDDSNKNNTSTNDPIFLFANLDTSKFYDSLGFVDQVYETLTPLELSYLNTIPAVLPIIKTRYNPAATFTITSNGLDGEGDTVINSFALNKTSFANTKIPFVLKLKDQDNFTTKSYPYLSSTDTTPLTSYYFKINLLDENNTIVPSVSFYKTDFEKDIFESGGFYRGYFVCDREVQNAKLSASVYIDDIPNFEQDTAFVFYSQPYTHYIPRIFSNTLYNSIPGSQFATTTRTYDYLDTIDNRSIFTITQIPSSNNSDNDYCFWAADSDSDRLLKMSYTGDIITTINLSAATLSDGTVVDLRNIYGSASPSSIALDNNNNAFVTLFDSGSVIRINNITNLIDRIGIPPVSALGTNAFLTSSDYITNQGWAGEFTFLPSSVDVDKNGEVYVVYTHPRATTLARFDNNLNYKKRISGLFGVNNYAQKIIIDRNNNIWLAATSKATSSTESPALSGKNDRVWLLKDTGTASIPVLTTFAEFKQIGDITVDGNQNCWVSHDISTVTKLEYNQITKEFARYDFNLGEVYGNSTDYLQSIEGISCNSLNEIVILNNFDLKIYFLDATATTQPVLSSLKQIQLQSAPNNFMEYPISAYYDSKYQAGGDFLGYNWINKYYYFASNTRVLTGTSSTFNIYPASGYNLMFKENENFDGEQMYRNMALMETLQDKNVFFDDFLGKIVGNQQSNANSALLKKIYEKIANFSDNIANVDTCNVDSLISKCNMFDVTYENYNYPYPASLKRVLDLASIKRNNLFGSKNQNNYSFSSNILETNLGSIINLETDTFSATEIIVAKEKFSGTYKPVNTTIINTYSAIDIISFSEFSYDWGWGLVAPQTLSGLNIGGYYDFYRLATTDQQVYDNIIDFNNENSNITFNLSTYSDFYGENGIVDQNITYAFVNGLRLISSAMNVYYN